jgi:hypothetical protein
MLAPVLAQVTLTREDTWSCEATVDTCVSAAIVYLRSLIGVANAQPQAREGQNSVTIAVIGGNRSTNPEFAFVFTARWENEEGTPVDTTQALQIGTPYEFNFTDWCQAGEGVTVAVTIAAGETDEISGEMGAEFDFTSGVLTVTPDTEESVDITLTCTPQSPTGTNTPTDETFTFDVADPSDTTAPTVPSNVTVLPCSTNGDTCLEISWDASTDASGIAAYYVSSSSTSLSACESNESFGSATIPPDTSRTSGGKTASTTYWFKVFAVDSSPAANESDWSSCASGTTDLAGGGGGGDLLSSSQILFMEDWEGYSAGVKTTSADFNNVWTRVGAGAGQACSITEIIASGGPKSGNAFRAFLEDSGTCGRAEIRLPKDTLFFAATYVGSAPVPTRDTSEYTHNYVYTSEQAATCTGAGCNPDLLGIAYSTTITKVRDDGGGMHQWQNLRPHFTSWQTEIGCPWHNQVNPNWSIGISEDEIDTLSRRNKSAGFFSGGTCSGGGGVTSTMATASDFGEASMEGLVLDIYLIFRPDSRTDAEGGNGEFHFYAELAGVEPTEAKFIWNGSTIHPGVYQFENASPNAGPHIQAHSMGAYQDPWQNNGISTLDSVEHRYDNIIWSDAQGDDLSTLLGKLYNTLQLENFSSLGW